ncbi:Dot/Icm secretion system substrate [Legionella wadsworthii]|uniref:Dot/Icm secretion system substrate n=1 Tax=Legionella wadsworthii TaxID=28088 RepID=A0A378LY19_9GAMM|nr:hypothetical protein [Legionella wadsworthii]STY31611.1 Dot/Icm secretion system substrate [Legionella wadsworthii]
MAKIKVASIDFDGCLSHQSYQESLKQNPEADRGQKLIEHNQLLMDRLAGFDKIMVGSNRQDVRGDVQESMKSNFALNSIDHTGSCFSTFHSMSEHLESTFDTFLLGDLYTQKPPGFTIQEAMKLQKDHKYSDDQKANNVAHISSWAFDHKKVSVVYAQIQKLSLENPNDEIEYNFVDDRTDILHEIEQFFKENPDLIPGNVKIKTVRYYNGNPDRHSVDSQMQVVERETIESNDKTTKANPFYAQTLRSWATDCKDETGELRPDEKENYKHLAKVHTSTQEAMQKLHHDFQGVLTLTKTSSKAANELIRSDLSQYSADSYRQKLVDVYKESWEKQYYAGKLSIGYSAVLRSLTRELANQPELLTQVKNDLKDSIQKDNTYERYRAGPTSFRDEQFEQDWNKFTGADVNIFQRAAKTIMQAFKKPKEEVELPKMDPGIHM